MCWSHHRQHGNCLLWLSTSADSGHAAWCSSSLGKHSAPTAVLHFHTRSSCFGISLSLDPSLAALTPWCNLVHFKSKLVYFSAVFHWSSLAPAGELWAAVRERNGSLWALILAGTCSFQTSPDVSTASSSSHGCVLIHLFPNRVCQGCLSSAACTFLFLFKLRMT